MKLWMPVCVLLALCLSSGSSAQAGDWVNGLMSGSRLSPLAGDRQSPPSRFVSPPQEPSQQFDPKFLPRGRAYYGNRYFGNFNNRYYGPQYGYF